MAKLLLCSISAIVLSLCVAQTVVAESTVVDTGNYEQTQRASKKRFGGKYVSKPQKANPVVVPAKKSTEYKEMITKAVVLHNFLNLLDDRIDQAREFEFLVKDKELSKKRLEDFNGCEVRLLSEHFKDPDKLWEKLKSEAEERLEEYNAETVAKAIKLENDVADMIALSDSERIAFLEEEKNKKHDVWNMITLSDSERIAFLEKEKNKKHDVWDTFEDDFKEINAEWEIGYVVLNSLYANQDAWAERKTEETASLPLWTDQKYLYDRDVWKPKYAQIVDHCKEQGIKLVKEQPEIKDDYKYDYYFYDKVEKAHDGFISGVIAQECILTPQMKEPPAVAPRPLPPVEENVLVVERPLQGMANEKAPHTSAFDSEAVPVVTEDSETVVGIYPQNPKNVEPGQEISFIDDTLWEVYKKEGFDDVAKDGEFRKFFDSSLAVTDAAKDAKENRISKYLSLLSEVSMTENAYENFLYGNEEIGASFDRIIDDYKLNVSGNLNYSKVADLEKLRDAIKEKKNELILQARRSMGADANTSNMTTEQVQENTYKTMLRALEVDEDGLVLLTRDTAAAIEDSIKEAKAGKVLMSTYIKEVNKLKEDLLADKNHKAQEGNCLTFNGDPLLDLKKVKIE